jgi:hypothetical protein
MKAFQSLYFIRISCVKSPPPLRGRVRWGYLKPRQKFRVSKTGEFYAGSNGILPKYWTQALNRCDLTGNPPSLALPLKGRGLQSKHTDERQAWKAFR